jgi:hypothetical protein
MPVGTEIISVERVRCDTGPSSVATVDLSSCLVHGIRKGIAASFQVVKGLLVPALDLFCSSGAADRMCAVLPTGRVLRAACGLT